MQSAFQHVPVGRMVPGTVVTPRVTTPHLFRGGVEGESGVVSREESREKEGKEPIIICRGCGASVTSRTARTEVGGSHSHTFFNPAGLVFELGCFVSAPGCLAVGETSGEFSWFAGYVWQVVLCRSCREHLGWRFVSGDITFYGLILTRLQDGEA